MVYTETSEGLSGFGFDEHDLLQSATNLHTKSLKEASLKQGKTVTYFVTPSKLYGMGPYELTIPSMDTECTDGQSRQMFGKFKIVKVSGSGVESDCTGTEDYSVINLPGNSIFKQLELYVGNGNVIDQSVSAYPYKCITEILLSMLR